jgi:peroxiredoxin Q/BCP
MIEDGQQAPALQLATTGGETIDLANPGGKIVLYFYPKDDTSG